MDSTVRSKYQGRRRGRWFVGILSFFFLSCSQARHQLEKGDCTSHPPLDFILLEGDANLRAMEDDIREHLVSKLFHVRASVAGIFTYFALRKSAGVSFPNARTRSGSVLLGDDE